MNILEIGCGDGGNLLPFAELGCSTTGVDISTGRIKDAILFFEERRITDIGHFTMPALTFI